MNYITIVTDKDSVIAISGTSKKDLLEEPISEKLEKIIDDRKSLLLSSLRFLFHQSMPPHL